MHTKDFLADELEKANLPEMAAKARTGWYHDFLSPLDTPCLQLSEDLRIAGTPEALALRERHHNGEFDASLEESEEWAKGPDGADAFAMLAASIKPGKDARPRFRTEGRPPGPVTVYIQCSQCEKDIRPMLKTESININRGYYCKDCDDGAVHLNMPEGSSQR